MLPPNENIRHSVAAALAEDVGAGDLTAQLIPAATSASATVISREPAILCGTAWFEECFHQVDPAISVEWLAVDGDQLEPGQWLCRIRGPARGLLTAERCALNFLQTLSATATLTRRYVDAVRNTHAEVMDTRKTLPGLRLAQKYAVTIGGGFNQRIGLFDGILIKENHIAAAGGIAAALAAATRMDAGVTVQVEVETLEELQQALDAGATLILLDNFSIDQLGQAVRLCGGRARLEASGGVTLESIGAIAATGVDRISVGSLTKDVDAVDFSMRFEAEPD